MHMKQRCSSTKEACLQTEVMVTDATDELQQSVCQLRSLVFQAARGRGGFLALYVEISELAELLQQVRGSLSGSKQASRASQF